jgi:hypothetical protein
LANEKQLSHAKGDLARHYKNVHPNEHKQDAQCFSKNLHPKLESTIKTTLMLQLGMLRKRKRLLSLGNKSWYGIFSNLWSDIPLQGEDCPSFWDFFPYAGGRVTRPWVFLPPFLY